MWYDNSIAPFFGVQGELFWMLFENKREDEEVKAILDGTLNSYS